MPRLRFVPAQKPDLTFPIFKVSEATSSAKISLRAYMEKVLGRAEGGERGGKKGGRARNPSEQEKAEGEDSGAEAKAPPPSQPMAQPSEDTPTPTVCACPSKGQGVDDDFFSHVWDDESLKRGWTAAEAGIMTFGELYLMVSGAHALRPKVKAHISVFSSSWARARS